MSIWYFEKFIVPIFNLIFQNNSVPDLVRPMEYWKSPPPPFVPTFDPYLPPPRPPRPNLKKKLSDTSSRGRDSAIGMY